MIPSFEIKNFRLFKHLVIDKLARVNLITGKNNVGKTCLLESLIIYTSKVSTKMIKSKFFDLQKISSELSISIQILFHYEKVNKEIILGPDSNEKENLSIKYIYYYDEWDENKTTFTRHIINHKNTVVLKKDPGLKIHFHRKNAIIPLDVNINKLIDSETFLIEEPIIPWIAISSSGIDDKIGLDLWDKIALNPLKEEVYKGLHLISPQIEGIDSVGRTDKVNERHFVVKLSDFDYPIPIEIVGEGVRRLLGIFLAIVNCKEGIVVIDEIENGIHYSIQPKLWKLILELAERLDVQVFATTHSWDSVEGFQEALNEFHDPGQGQLVRLKEKNEDIKALILDAKDLAIATRDDIEVR